MNKTITIPYEEYLEMEKCKKIIDNIKEKLRKETSCNVSTLKETNNKYLELYEAEDLFKIIDEYIDRVVHIEIFR